MAKTDWQMGDTVLPDDLNQIGQEINDNAAAITNHTAATTSVHGATSAATANRIVQRDSSGRAKFAAPAASDDAARKAEVDAVQTNLNTHKSAMTLDHPDGSVTTAKLADGAVTSGKLADTAVSTAKIADSAVTEAKIANSAVTANKIASGAVTSAKLASGAATDTVIGNRTITDTSAPSSDSGTLTNLLSWLGYMIKAITGKSNWRTAPATTLEAAAAHIANTNNPHGVTKSQVGLGNVQNYGIASQSQAEAGTASNVYMTPQRTKQYVDTRLRNNISFRINSGVVEYYNGSGWVPVAGLKSVQRGTASLTSGKTTSVTISPVNPSKAFVNLNVFGTPSTNNRHISLRLENSTTLIFTQEGNYSITPSVEWEVVEFY